MVLHIHRSKNLPKTSISKDNSLSIDSNPGKSNKKSNEKDKNTEELGENSNITGKNKHEIGPVIPNNAGNRLIFDAKSIFNTTFDYFLAR